MKADEGNRLTAHIVTVKSGQAGVSMQTSQEKQWERMRELVEEYSDFGSIKLPGAAEEARYADSPDLIVRTFKSANSTSLTTD